MVVAGDEVELDTGSSLCQQGGPHALPRLVDSPGTSTSVVATGSESRSWS